MDSYEELKQIIKSQQDKREKEFLDKLNSHGKKRFNSKDDINNFVDNIIDNKSNSNKEDIKKNIVNLNEIEKDGFIFGIVTTTSRFKDYKSLEELGKKVPTITIYRTYMIINKDDDIIDNLLYKQFKEKNLAIEYYNELLEYVQKSEVSEIFKKIEESL